jgi:hypothetical protein
MKWHLSNYCSNKMELTEASCWILLCAVMDVSCLSLLQNHTTWVILKLWNVYSKNLTTVSQLHIDPKMSCDFVIMSSHCQIPGTWSNYVIWLLNNVIVHESCRTEKSLEFCQSKLQYNRLLQFWVYIIGKYVTNRQLEERDKIFRIIMRNGFTLSHTFHGGKFRQGSDSWLDRTVPSIIMWTTT